MTLDDYQDAASAFGTSHPEALTHYALGLAGEAGEAVDVIKKHVAYGRPLDHTALRLELGDVLWYVAMVALAAGWNLEDIAHDNLHKLTNRPSRVQ